MVHFGESRGVLAFFVIVGNRTDTNVQRRVKGIHKSRLAHSRMTRKQAYLPLHQGFKFLDLETRLSRNAERGVAKLLVVFHQNAHFANLLVGVKVTFVEDDGCGNVIGFGSHQKAVDEARGGARLGDGCHHNGQIHVGGDDMRSLTQVNRLPDNHIVTWLNLLDDARFLARFLFKFNIVADGHGIGGTDAVQTDFSAQTTLPLPSRFVEDDVPASRRFDDLA